MGTLESQHLIVPPRTLIPFLSGSSILKSSNIEIYFYTGMIILYSYYFSFLKLFHGNWHNLDHATHLFARDISAQYVRLIPISYYDLPMLRMEVLGCKGNLLRIIAEGY